MAFPFKSGKYEDSDEDKRDDKKSPYKEGSKREEAMDRKMAKKNPFSGRKM